MQKAAIPQANMVSLATALPLSTTANLICVKKNLRFRNQNIYATIYHRCSACRAYFRLSTCAMPSGKSENSEQEAYQSEQEVIACIKEKIKKIPEDRNYT